MKLLSRNLVNLSTKDALDSLAHVSRYELNSGNLYNVFFIEARYFGFEEVCCKTNKIIKEERALDEYDYKIDIFFNDKERDLGWNLMFKDW